MSDIAERVRALCPHDVSGYCECTAQEAADKITRLEHELSAAQAREKMLRDALAPFANGELDFILAKKALAQPTDDTALRGLLEHENSVWYSALGPNYVDFNPVGAVRAFEAQVKLEAMCEMERYHDTALKAALAAERGV